MKNLMFLGFVFLTLCGLARAEDTKKGGFFLEPMLTYENGDSKIPYKSPVKDSDGDINGFGAGLRLGFHAWESVFVGVDGRYSQPNFKDSSLDQDVKSTAYNYGPVVGLQMPTDLGIRVWGSYVMNAQIDPEKDKGVDEKFTKGKGYRLGSGIKLGIVSLNVEYQYIKYDNLDVQDAGILGSGSFKNVDMTNSSWIFSVSFPVAM